MIFPTAGCTGFGLISLAISLYMLDKARDLLNQAIEILKQAEAEGKGEKE